MEFYILIILFFTIATLYSSAGFGGGSSYIALLLLAQTSVVDSRFTALVCNMIVVSSACIFFYKSGHLKIKKVAPLLILSIPLAFAGGAITPDTEVYKTIAAIALIIAACLMMIRSNKNQEKKDISPISLALIGGGIGLLSGFIGIGGGIFLAPILYFINWQSPKVISATASIFILVNSVSGLAGQLSLSPDIDYKMVISLGLAVLAGGRLGNRMNIHILPPNKIKLITAMLIGLVGIRILLTI